MSTTSPCTSDLLHKVYERFARMFSRDGVNLQHYGGRWLAFKPQDVLRPNAPVLLEDTPTDPRFTYDDFCRWARHAAQDGEVVLVRIEPTLIRLAAHASVGASTARQSIGMQRAMSISVASTTGTVRLEGGVSMRADGSVAGAFRPVAASVGASAAPQPVRAAA